MPIVVTKIDVKPEDQQFRHRHDVGGLREEHRADANPYETLALDYVQWASSFPGVLDRRGYPKDENTWVTVTVFEDQEAYDRFREAAKNHPYRAQRTEYANSIGITSTTTVDDLPAK
jgi:hypothetical protein